MTRKEAVTILKYVEAHGSLVKEAKEKAIEALEREPRWIPVSERLPKTFEFVNCTCHSLIDDREDWVVETVYIPQPP